MWESLRTPWNRSYDRVGVTLQAKVRVEINVEGGGGEREGSRVCQVPEEGESGGSCMGPGEGWASAG